MHDISYYIFIKTKSIRMRQILFILFSFYILTGWSSTYNDTIKYRIEMSSTISKGTYAPTWLTANRYGLGDAKNKNAYVRTKIGWNRQLNNNWKIETAFDVAGGLNKESNIWLQQAYMDVSWKFATLSIGSKENRGKALEKNPQLTSGWMVEGINARPIPQIRLEISDYTYIPGCNHWAALKAHVCYGIFTDGEWQENFVAPNNEFTKNVLYHSKSLMFRIGNREKLPIEFEFGLLTGAQFGGERMKKNKDGSISMIRDMPDAFKDFWKAFFPTQSSTLENVQGNHCGSWNFGLNIYKDLWRLRAYMEHYFEDHSQMFLQYGKWKDKHIGIEITPPENPFIKAIVLEELNTTDQTGPILYDGVGGSFTDLQMSGGDNYYNNGEYLGWQNYGSVLGHPLLYGPEYNADKSNSIKSNRIKALHIGIEGEPNEEWSWRFMLTHTKHWGTYKQPLDRVRKQISGMAEITYTPRYSYGWSFTGAIGADKGDYLGNSGGCLFTIKKTGIICL